MERRNHDDVFPIELSATTFTEDDEISYAKKIDRLRMLLENFVLSMGSKIDFQPTRSSRMIRNVFALEAAEYIIRRVPDSAVVLRRSVCGDG